MRAFVFEPIRKENVEKLKEMGVNILPAPVPVPAPVPAPAPFWGYGNEPDDVDFSPALPPVPEKPEEKETESELVERLEKLADTQEQPQAQTQAQTHKEQIYKAICQLAMACDGASSKDGQGFNKTDAFFGHSLAKQARWSEKQYYFASKMLQKYKKQIGEIALYEAH